MKKFNFVMALILAVLSAFSCGIKLWIEYELWAIACYAATVIALPFSSLMHELGHILVGAMCKIKAVPKFKLFGSSSVKLIPKTDKHLRPKLYFTAMAGLAVNLIIIIVSSIPIYYGVLPAWLCVFLPSSVYLFLLNLWGDEKTDGYICSSLINNTDEAKVMVAVMTVQTQVLSGKPIEEADEKLLFDLPVIREDAPAFISLTELRYEYFKAKGDEEQAEKYKERLEDLKQYID